MSNKRYGGIIAPMPIRTASSREIKPIFKDTP
jgi:hypothetical protein